MGHPPAGAPAPGRGRRALGGRQLALIAVAVQAAIGVVLLVLDVFLGSPGPGGARGSGVAATQTRALAGFSGLDLAGSSTVTVVVGGEQLVVVHADDNLLGRVTTRVEAGTLVIGSGGSFTTKSPMSVEVSVPSLQVLTLSGSGAISATGITAPALTVTLFRQRRHPRQGNRDSSGRRSRRFRPGAAYRPGCPRRARGRSRFRG
jgi:putative autotransporter adhesin-like protein